MESLTCTIGCTHGMERVNSDKASKINCIAFKYGQTLLRNVRMCVFFIVSAAFIALKAFSNANAHVKCERDHFRCL